MEYNFLKEKTSYFTFFKLAAVSSIKFGDFHSLF